MTDPFEHLNALRTALSHEQGRLGAARTKSISDIRAVKVKALEREVAGEIAYLARRGIVEAALPSMTDDELLAELAAL